jgi:uncharacterized membrane protein YoaK (UPF0700 family)
LAGAPTSSDNTIWQACLLAAVGGYADAVGFLTFNAFAGAMTGNTVLLGIALAADKLGDAAQSAGIIAAFVVGVTASILLRQVTSVAGILCLEMAAIMLAALMPSLAAAPVLAFAMGLQNTAMTHFTGGAINTVFLTGNLQTLARSVVNTPVEDRTARRETIALVGTFWFAYLAGIIAGALAWHWTAHPLLFAVLPLPLVLLRRSAWRSEG